MAVTHAVLYPCKGEKKAIAIRLLISQLAINEFAILLDGTAFHLFAAGEDAVDNMQVWIGRAYLYSDRGLVGRELFVRHVEPVVSRRGGTLVVQAEHYEGQL